MLPLVIPRLARGMTNKKVSILETASRGEKGYYHLGEIMQNNKNSKVEQKKEEQSVHKEEPVHELTQAEVDEELDESFPSSDPPSWTLGTRHHKEQDKDKK